MINPNCTTVDLKQVETTMFDDIGTSRIPHRPTPVQKCFAMCTVILAHQFRRAQYVMAPYGTRQSSAKYSALLLCRLRHWDARNLHVHRAQLVPAGKVEG